MKLPKIIALVLACASWVGALQAQAQTPSCAGLPLETALGTGEQFLQNNGADSNRNAIRCALDAYSQAQESKVQLSALQHYRLGNIASNAVESLGGAYMLGASDNWNQDIAQIWSAYLEKFSDRMDTQQRVRATRMLIVHGRNGDFSVFFPSVMASVVTLDRRVPEDFPDLVYSTLYRCPSWELLQKDNVFPPSEVPCLQQCRQSAVAVRDAVALLLDKNKGVMTSGLKAFRTQNPLLVSRLSCK